ncbi:MAG: Flp pilus assembly complex ATPase component TadA [Candidatus Omnitrophica bacterium]|nr:Flp pilus assembly complex ATPase component TadA [Candidatus Omnitrophota bacterium]
MEGNILSIRDKITKVLIDKKLLTENDIKKAVELQKNKGGKLSDIFVGMGLVSRSDLTLALSEELGIPPIDLSRYTISQELVKLIPKKTAKNYRVMPVSAVGKLLTLATADPLNVFAIDDISTLTGYKISVVIADENDINHAIAENYEAGATEAIEKIIGGMEPQDIRMVEEADRDSLSSTDLIKLTQDAPVVKVTNMVLAEGVRRRASDILIEPLENALRIRYRIDGILQEAERPPKRIHQALVSRIKVMSDLNIAERRLPQDGRFKLKIHHSEVDFRVSIIPSSTGEKVALRILDKSQAMLNLDKLGFEEKTLADIKAVSKRPHGMILSCGPTGCGKTTTLYSILKFVDSPEKNIITAEDPVEYQLEGINQLTVQPEMGLTFSSSLRSFLRQDPDIIMVGEIRDFETVDIAIKAALTGHLVLSTLHTTTASGSIIRLVNMGVEPFLITSSLILVVAQRLVRRICLNCREEYKITDETARKLKLKAGVKRVAYHGKGCKECRSTGYRGRVGLAETLVLSPKIRELVMKKAQEYEIKAASRREGMTTLRENGIEKALRGETTLEEILRVTVGDQEINMQDKG